MQTEKNLFKKNILPLLIAILLFAVTAVLLFRTVHHNIQQSREHFDDTIQVQLELADQSLMNTLDSTHDIVNYFSQRSQLQSAAVSWLETHDDSLFLERSGKNATAGRLLKYFGISWKDELISLSSDGERLDPSFFTMINDEDPDHRLYVDTDGVPYLALLSPVFLEDFRYISFIPLTELYAYCFNDELLATRWAVLKFKNCNYYIDNDAESPRIRSFTEEELRERQDGYTYMNEQEQIGKIGCVTYEYKLLHEPENSKTYQQRLAVLPYNESQNGLFSAAVSYDETPLMKSLIRSWLSGLVAILIFFVTLAFLLITALRSRHRLIESQQQLKMIQLEQETAELNNRLHDIEIQTATSQMQPHFLYNALSSIRELIWVDQQYASDMLVNLTSHLRACIHSMFNNTLVDFNEELNNIQAYVSIEKMRFGDKLNVIYDIQTSDFKVVPLGIQPLVENAIRHGVYKRGKAGGTVILHTEKQGDEILVRISDNGVGFNLEQYRKDIADGTGDSTGLQNTMIRLQHLQNASMEIESEENIGTTVTVRLPRTV